MLVNVTPSLKAGGCRMDRAYRTAAKSDGRVVRLTTVSGLGLDSKVLRSHDGLSGRSGSFTDLSRTYMIGYRSGPTRSSQSSQARRPIGRRRKMIILFEGTPKCSAKRVYLSDRTEPGGKKHSG